MKWANAVSVIRRGMVIVRQVHQRNTNISITKRSVNSVDLQDMDIAQPALLVSTDTGMVEINAFGAGQVEWGTAPPVQVMSTKSNL